MASAVSNAPGFLRDRWVQLVFGIVAMVMIANLQYGWTLFVLPLQDAHGWKKDEIQFAFFLFVLFQTWIVPLNGYLVDRFGPTPFVALAGIFVAAGWTLAGHATTLPQLYTGQIFAGLGAGFVYGTVVGLAVKWFPDRRGLAVGLAAAGFGSGTILTVIPIQQTIKAAGYEVAFERFGLVQGIIIVLIAFLLRFPRTQDAIATVATAATARQSRVNATPLEMLKTPQFYVLYVMMTMIATGLLFMTAQISPIAKDYGLDKALFPGLAMATLSLALIVDQLCNGVSRVIFGSLSDRMGRELTMATAFSCMALGLVGLLFAAHNPILFVLAAGMTFIASGEIYSLFPATCTDLYGTRYATTNSGLLYTAKGTAALVVPIASLIHDKSGSWAAIIGVLIAFNIIVAYLAMRVLKPMRERYIARTGSLDDAQTAPVVTPAAAT